MTDMGRRNLMNGHRGEDGATAASAIAPAMAPFPMPHLGPVSTWTPPLPNISAPAMSVETDRGDRLRRGSMWVLASGVAAIAAIVSYSHIYDLGIAHGGSGVAARLLPLSVDMLILVGELMLLHEADSKGRRFVLGWVLVWSGILATLAANVAYGAQYGVVGALIWGWPAYSFILAAGGMVAVVKRGATRDIELDKKADATVDKADVTVDIEAPSPLVSTGNKPDIPLDIPVAPKASKPRTSPKAAAGTSRRTLTAGEKVTAILRDNPEMSNAEVAKKAGVSTKTVSRARASVAPKETP